MQLKNVTLKQIEVAVSSSLTELLEVTTKATINTLQDNNKSNLQSPGVSQTFLVTFEIATDPSVPRTKAPTDKT